MSEHWQPYLDRWTAAGLMDAATAVRVRDWEREHSQPHGLRWPIVAALAFGALLLSAGVLLFVSAHWEELSPGQRMGLVLSAIAAFHVGGAFAASRFEGLSIALHTIGTVALGAGIALAGQTFHLSEHWPGAILMWAVGAAVAWALLRHWTQGLFTAILAPAWVLSEWSYQLSIRSFRSLEPILLSICALSFIYLAARRSPDDSSLRKALGWLGGIALLPTVLAIVLGLRWDRHESWDSWPVRILLLVLIPIALAAFARGKETIGLGLAMLWTLVWMSFTGGRDEEILSHLWCAVGSVGLVAWGVQSGRPERINLGMAGFAITLLFFYFSSVMDKLGRSASLIGLGVLFLFGGWLLERLRRQFMTRIRLEVA